MDEKGNQPDANKSEDRGASDNIGVYAYSSSFKIDQSLLNINEGDVEKAETGRLTKKKQSRLIIDREDEYRQKRFQRNDISPEREDPFNSQTNATQRNYSDIMAEAQEQQKRQVLVSHIKEQQGDSLTQKNVTLAHNAKEKGDSKLDKWDAPTPISQQTTWSPKYHTKSQQIERESEYGETPAPGEWAPTPLQNDESTDSSRWQSTTKSRFQNHVKTNSEDHYSTTPFSSFGKSPLESTPLAGTPLSETPLIKTETTFQATPLTPLHFPEGDVKVLTDERRRPLTDDEINKLLPSVGYEIIDPPPEYLSRRQAQPAATDSTPMYTIPGETQPNVPPELATEGDMDEIPLKAEDYQFFGKVFTEKPEDELTPDEVRERKILALLLQIKNGQHAVRRQALRTITERARDFGPGPLFNQLLPLMMSSTLEDQERHLLVKVIDRVLYKLDDQVRPYVHKILVVIEPLLIDEDYYARVEGREIISNLAKAAGLATMIATMRPDIDHPDEYVRNTTARAFAVVASALGIPSMILFLKAVCQSKKSWQARHTGIKIVQQIAILVGCGILPQLKVLVETIAHGLQDDQLKLRIISALAIAALAEAAHPYGIEAFDCVLRPLWKGITEHRGKGLAAFLKAIGMIIPLMDAHHASYYTKEVMTILINEFSTPDDEMKRIVMKVVQQCISTTGIESSYIKSEIMPPFFNRMFVVRNALDKRNVKLLITTTTEIASKVSTHDVLSSIIDYLKDPSEPFRRMVIETIESVVQNNPLGSLDRRMEEQLIDGILYTLQEQTSEDAKTVINAIGTIMTALGTRVKPYLPQIAGIIRWRLNTPSARVRQQAADLVTRIAVIMKICDEEQILCHLALFLYEYLGEEYPEVLGSILAALKAIINVVGVQKITIPIKDLLPRLTPILRNRHEKVQENVIDLIGRIADKGGDLVPPKEWDRICFDLLELLKAQKKSIRRATVNTFGYIARTIGPHDVLSTLLNNLKVQERQLRVCTTIAIAIVAETCGPYSILPSLMNEYKLPELNVQNGVLKTFSFMFEYIGEMGKDYIYAVTPLLEHALMDRDIVHRQTASWVCKHLALGVTGLGCKDSLLHLLNYVWPNIFEMSPHLVQAFMDAVDGFRVTLGPAILLNYTLQGLFHPCRRVREIYWRIYNNIYIGHQDALVPIYPELTLENSRRRNELYCII